MRGENQVRPYKGIIWLYAAQVAVFLLLAPCTLGFSLIGLPFVVFPALFAIWIQNLRLDKCLGDAPARAWAPASRLGGSVWAFGGNLWVVEDELFFSVDEEGESWKLDELQDLRFEPYMGLWRAVCWRARGKDVRFVVHDPDGWMRVLEG